MLVHVKGSKMNKKRCSWCGSDPLYLAYHDTEWGVPVYDDQRLFELLILEGMQAGLNWLTILKKRNSFRAAFDHFNVKKIAQYDADKIAALLMDADIIRNKLKIHAAVQNAQAFLEIKKEWNSFSEYIWSFVNGQPVQNHWKNSAEVPAKTAISDAMSKDLKKRGFKFVGSTICYAFMQAAGMVNDHALDCFRYKSKSRGQVF
jgi:DNA-3-methyladenine glycosylase I